MNKLQADVTEFHKAMDHPAPDEPVLELTPEIIEALHNRAKWMREEADELDEALDANNLVGVIDALGDSTYFSVGGYVVLGHNMEAYWDNIQGSNMEKLDPVTGKPVPHPTMKGKIGKPEGWVPPEAKHEAVLEQLRLIYAPE